MNVEKDLRDLFTRDYSQRNMVLFQRHKVLISVLCFVLWFSFLYFSIKALKLFLHYYMAEKCLNVYRSGILIFGACYRGVLWGIQVGSHITENSLLAWGKKIQCTHEWSARNGLLEIILYVHSRNISAIHNNVCRWPCSCGILSVASTEPKSFNESVTFVENTQTPSVPL